MIGVHIIAEWLAAFIESILYFKIVSVIFETQFSKKKTNKVWLIFIGIYCDRNSDVKYGRFIY